MTALRVTFMCGVFIGGRLCCDQNPVFLPHFHLCHEPNHSGDRPANLGPVCPREIAGPSCPSASYRPAASGHSARGRCLRPTFLSPEPSHHHYRYNDVGLCFLCPPYPPPSLSL